MFGPDPAIWPDSLQRAGALGLLRQLLAMDVVDAEGFDEDVVGDRTFNKDITGWDECETL